MPFNVQAALGLAQFRRIDELVGIKRKHLNFYRKELLDLKLQFNYEPNNVINGAWATTLVLDNSYGIDKSEFINRLQKIGVPSRPFFYPLSSLPPFDSDVKYNKKEDSIYVTNLDGPLKHLENKWYFKEENNVTEVSFDVDFELIKHFLNITYIYFHL